MYLLKAIFLDGSLSYWEMMGLTNRKGVAMKIDKERNKIGLDRISFHLDQTMRFCNQLDLSGLGPLEQK